VIDFSWHVSITSASNVAVKGTPLPQQWLSIHPGLSPGSPSIMGTSHLKPDWPASITSLISNTATFSGSVKSGIFSTSGALIEGSVPGAHKLTSSSTLL